MGRVRAGSIRPSRASPGSAKGIKVVDVRPFVEGLREGRHAVHIHEVASCQPCAAAGELDGRETFAAVELPGPQGARGTAIGAPNTGGGANSPAPALGPAVHERDAEVITPTLRGMAEEGHPYRGSLYAGS